MKRVKYLSVLFVGTLVYVLLSVTVGQNSFKSYKKMEEQKRIVSKQKADIQNINTELSLELTALKSDKAVDGSYSATNLAQISYQNEGLEPFSSKLSL